MTYQASEREYQRPDQQPHIPHEKGRSLRSDRRLLYFRLTCSVALIRSPHDVDDLPAATRNTDP